MLNVNSMARLRLLGLASVAVVMTGCASLNVGSPEYGCSGMPDGVQCMSTRDVYNATNNGSVPRPMKAGDEDQGDEPHAEVSPSPQRSGDEVIDTYVAPQLPNKPVPIRTPAQVMRIWVAPWEDDKGDLNVSGYVYTEIEPRRWVIGESTSNSDSVIRPLQSSKH